MKITPLETITTFQIDNAELPVGIVIERLNLSNVYDEYLICHNLGSMKMIPLKGNITTLAPPKDSFNSEALKKAVLRLNV